MGQSPQSPSMAPPPPWCAPVSPAGGTTDLGPSHNYLLSGAPTLSESGPWGLQHPSAQGQRLSASCLASGPTCSSCAIVSIFLSSGTTSCVLVSRGALGLRTPDPVVTSSLPSSLLGAPGPAPSPGASSLFLEDSDGRPSCLPGWCCLLQAHASVSSPGPVAVWPGLQPPRALETQPGSLCFRSCNQRGISQVNEERRAYLQPLGHHAAGRVQDSAGRQPLLSLVSRVPSSLWEEEI